jgi:hypothetical protein
MVNSWVILAAVPLGAPGRNDRRDRRIRNDPRPFYALFRLYPTANNNLKTMGTIFPYSNIRDPDTLVITRQNI